MAAETGAVWAIDIGHNSLKALYLSTERGYIEVLDFDNIPHEKNLSSENVSLQEREELIALSLRKLVTTHDLSAGDIAISVPSQNSFIRFVNLPPVEQKRIPEMVRFEAVQQIPFDINDIQWDWQLMSEPDSPELKVGIFAVKNEISDAAMEPLIGEDIEVNYVQIAPMALYNFLLHDRPELVTGENQAAVVINIGATNTDIIVCTKTTVWQRCVLIGGNNFSKAIADNFRLNFEKAEKLKHTAAMSKYARQIFQAMKPVFTDLTSEVQRSLGFYSSANPNTKVVRIVAMGGGTKLRGLLKYMQQTLQMPVERPDSFKKLAIAPGVSQAKFHENVGDFGIVYGLALQGLGLASIESNLLPRTIARSREWAKKGRYFITAACMLLVFSLMTVARTGLDKMSYSKNGFRRSNIQRLISSAETASSNLESVQIRAEEFENIISSSFSLFNNRDMSIKLYKDIISALPNEKNNPEQAQLYQAFAEGYAQEVMKTPRKERKQIFITGMSGYYCNDLEEAVFDETAEEYKGRLEGMYSEEALEAAEIARQDAELMGEVIIPPVPGYVLTIIGYTPYGETLIETGSIFDPPLVGDEQAQWGFITRLGHLDLISDDGGSPLRIYKKGISAHYVLDIYDVDLTKELAPGIGKYDIRYTTSNSEGEEVLIDPLTNEIISKTAIYNAQGVKQSDKVNDRWFILKIKFELVNENTEAAEATEELL